MAKHILANIEDIPKNISDNFYNELIKNDELALLTIKQLQQILNLIEGVSKNVIDLHLVKF